MAPAAASAETARFEQLVASAPSGASAGEARRRLEQLWGEGPLERTSLRANVEQLRRLDLPVILEMFHPARAETCSLALLALDGEGAQVSIMAETLRLPWAQVDALWTRQAIVPWRDFDGVRADAERAQAWLRERLARLGYLREGVPAEAAVSLFQRDAGLVVDGVVGTRTLMALYARGEHQRPRLRGGAS